MYIILNTVFIFSNIGAIFGQKIEPRENEQNTCLGGTAITQHTCMHSAASSSN
jgi:hypothetical protein